MPFSSVRCQKWLPTAACRLHFCNLKKKKREREIIDQSCRSKALSYLGITVYERFLLFTKTNVMYRGVRANCLGLPYEK